MDSGIGIFGGLFFISSITQIFHILIFIISLLILTLTGFYPKSFRNINNESIISKYTLKGLGLPVAPNSLFKLTSLEQYSILEYTLVYLFVVIGSVLLISSNDLISLFLSVELQSYGLYLLCAIYRNSETSTSSSLTYFLLGGLASCFILLGIGLIYANVGVTYLDNFYIINNLSLIIDLNVNELTGVTSFVPYSMLLIIVGLLFKISAAPFHFWSPDVYDGIPTVVTAFVANIAKISVLILILQLVHFTSSIYISNNYSWTTSLLLSSLLSLIIGTVLGLTQFRIKRLLAYSTISHLGFMLLALSINSVESIQSFIFYLIQYSLSNINAFIILIAIGYSLLSSRNINYNELQEDEKNSPVQLISQLKGFFYENSVLALSFAITLFSFAGIPPLMGFFAKQMVFSSALQEGFVFLTLIGVLTSVVSAVYYLYIIKTMFFDKVSSINKQISMLSSSLSIIISILTLIILLFMFIPNELLHISNILSVLLFLPSSL
jgi:NADH-ubiquinone oxidoreductase chain 2